MSQVRVLKERGGRKRRIIDAGNIISRATPAAYLIKPCNHFCLKCVWKSFDGISLVNFHCQKGTPIDSGYPVVSTSVSLNSQLSAAAGCSAPGPWRNLPSFGDLRPLVRSSRLCFGRAGMFGWMWEIPGREG